MSTITIDESCLVAFVVETFAYGLLTTLFFNTLHIVIGAGRKNGRRPNILVLFTLVGLFIVATTHVAINFSRALDAFITFRDALGGPLLYYANQANVKNVVKTGFYVLQALLGDGFMTYRLWVVWQLNIWIVILPILVLVVGIVDGGYMIYQFSQFTFQEDFFNDLAGHIIVADFSLAVALNLYCSVLIAYKVWSTQRFMSRGSTRVGGQNLKSFAAIVVESAVLYTSWTLAVMVAYLCKSNVQFILIDPLCSIVGIAFTLVIVRMAHSSETTTSSRGQSSSLSRTAAYSGQATASYSLKPMHIEITREHDVETRQGSYDLEQYKGNMSHAH